METHLHLLRRLPSPPHRTKASPWRPTLIHPTTPHISTLPTQRSTNLRAKGKGFGSPIPEKKRRPKQEQDRDDINASEDDDGGDDDDEIPQVVFDRVLRRVLSYVAVPMASGLGLIFVLSQLKGRGLWEVPGWLALLTVLLAFGTSALGMAYGTLSTSWDPDREGSLLGWEEALKNWPEVMRKQGDDKA